MSISPSSVDTENPRRQEERALPAPQSPAEGWDITQERLLRYLKCLNVPPGKEQLTLALESLARLGAQGGNRTSPPRPWSRSGPC